MKVADFDFDLPPERIAQRPAERRDASRLLVQGLASGRRLHTTFAHLPDFLRARDLLVLNDTRVIPARLFGSKESGGRVELLLTERDEGHGGSGARWRCLLRPARRTSIGSVLDFSDGLHGRVVGRNGEDWLVEFHSDDGAVEDRIHAVGTMPLPPYIRRGGGDEADLRRLRAIDRMRYQTVYARHPGAIAAPTAGLHFTPELLRRLELAGVETAYVTLHVGIGTFQPVRVEEVESHRMHEERFEVGASVAEAVQRARARGGRVVAVGTTVVRALETRAGEGRIVEAGRGRSDLFIYPGYDFRVVDALVTNFHLPRSSLLMLVCAFAGRERVLSAYREAIEQGYRFYSYGDAMLCIPDL